MPLTAVLPRPSPLGWFVPLGEPAHLYVRAHASEARSLDAVAALAQAHLYAFDALALAPLLDELRAAPAPYAALGDALDAEDAVRRGEVSRGHAALARLGSAPAPLRAWAGLMEVDALERGGEVRKAEAALAHPSWDETAEPKLLRLLLEARLLFRHGQVKEAADVLEAGAPLCDAAPPPLVPTFHRTLAIYLSVVGDKARGMQYHRLALEGLRRLGDNFMLAKEYLSLSQSYHEGDELDHAEFFLRKAAEVIEQLDDAHLTALLGSRRGALALLRGELPAAKELFERDLAISTRAGLRHGQGYARRNLGKVLARLGEPARGREHLEQAVEDFVAMSDDFNEHLTRLEVASVLLGYPEARDAKRARRELDDAAQFFGHIGRADLLAQISAVRARLYVDEGKPELACSEMAAAQRELLAHKCPERLIESLLLFADACLGRGLDEAAKEHLATAYRESIKASRPGLTGMILDRLGLIDERAVMDLAGEPVTAPGEKRPAEPEQFRQFLLASRSPAVREVMKDARRVAPTDETVLIEGETGVGKGVLASFIHSVSRRAQGPLFALNCGAIPESLIESELFGHEKGAFTNATSDRVGVLESADGGAAFLDEIGELSPRGQVMLLRFLESHEILPVGSSTSRRVDVRVIAATNRNLLDEVRAGRFRSDLYFRLAVYPIRIPSLRERRADLQQLARFILARTPHAQEKGILDFTPAALKRLAEHTWPGNLRELDNVIRAASIRCQGKQIGQQDLPSGLGDVSIGGSTFPKLAEVTRRHINEAVRLTNGNLTKAAELLGVHRNTLQAKARSARGGKRAG